MALPTELYFAALAFLDRGGVVLYAIFALAFVLWALVFERLLYIHVFARREGRALGAQWGAYAGHRRAAAVAASLRHEFKYKLLLTLPLIQTLVKVTPMLGLFGTVYGMVEVFDVIARQGTGDARALANGISLATLPTMSGMAVAIVGLFLLRHLESAARAQLDRFDRELAP